MYYIYIIYKYILCWLLTLVDIVLATTGVGKSIHHFSAVQSIAGEHLGGEKQTQKVGSRREEKAPLAIAQLRLTETAVRGANWNIIRTLEFEI